MATTMAIRPSARSPPTSRTRPRARAGLAPDESGVRIDFVFPESSADGEIEPGDVLLAVDGYDIANDGTVAIEGLRLHYGVLLDRHQVGGRLMLRMLRKGEKSDLALTMKRYPPLDRYANVYDRAPRYYVYAGLVFVPLSREMLKTYGDDFASRADKHLALWRERTASAGDRNRDLVSASRSFNPSYLEQGPIALVRVATDLPDSSVNGEWVGLAKLTTRGAERVRAELDTMAADGSLASASLPDLFTRLARGDDPPRVVYFAGHWMDVDDAFDLARAGDFL